MKNILNSELIPRRQTTGSAGYDIYAVEDICITPNQYTTVDTGVVLEEEVMTLKCGYPCEDICKCETDNFVALIMPRSSMGFKYGLRFSNTVCVIDKDYRDTIKLSMKSDVEFMIKAGERYAQLIFVPYLTCLYEIKPTAERCGGIGSTN